MSQLPNVFSGVTINRIEVWVTNKSGVTTNTRNIVAFTDLAEQKKISDLWSANGSAAPDNNSNTLYSNLNGSLSGARNITQATSVLDAAGLVGGNDYEKLETARLLNSSEYKVNTALGYISLKSTLQPDQVLAVAYEYTYKGQTFQVGEFSSDIKDNQQVLYVKALKNTACTPQMGNWDLMMKTSIPLVPLLSRATSFV